MLLALAAPACSSDSDGKGSGRTAAQEPTVCDDPPPFEATALPADFADDLRVGSGGQVTVSEAGAIEPSPDQAASHHHFRGPPGRFIDVIRGSTAIAPVGGGLGNAEPVDVLGGVGEVGEVHEGYGVAFRLGTGDCDRYLLAGYGVTRDDLVEVAEGLRLGE